MKLRLLKGYKYQVLEPEDFDTDIMEDIDTAYISLVNGLLTAKAGYAFDGPSGPTIDTRTFMRGSLAHDCLYQLIREGKLNFSYRKYADDLLKKICLEDGMARWRAWYVHKAVRMFAKKSSKPRKKPRGRVISI